jgi:hypothetical protein
MFVTDWTKAVGVLGLTVAFVGEGNAFEETRSIETAQVLLGDPE